MQTDTNKAERKNTKKENSETATDMNGTISVFDTHEQAENAVKKMQRFGFDMRKLSIMGRDYQTEENVIGFYNMGDRTKYWGKAGAFWGGILGLFFGSALFLIPGVGPVVIAGSFVSFLVAAIEGAAVVGGLSAFGAALVSIGIPKNSIVEYETALKAGKYVMIAHGTSEDLNKARELVNNIGAKNIADFDASNSSSEKKSARH